jgi:hypothetical protein
MENQIRNSPFSILHSQLLVFPVQPVAATATAELVELKPVRRVLFVLRRHVVPLFALGALQNYVVPSSLSHFFPLSLRFQISDSKFQIQYEIWNLESGI